MGLTDLIFFMKMSLYLYKEWPQAHWAVGPGLIAQRMIPFLVEPLILGRTHSKAKIEPKCHDEPILS